MTKSRALAILNGWREFQLDTIHSARLELIAMSPDFLEACLKGELESASQTIGLLIPPEWLEMKWLMELRLKQMRENPVLVPWILRAVGLRETKIMIGHVGFHTLPGAEYLNPYARGSVEFGYSIFPNYRRMGYASEAAQALMDWATREHEVTHFIVSISPTNEPSLRLAKKFGFHKVGAATDDEGGVEDVFLLNT